MEWLQYRDRTFKLHSGAESHWFVDADLLWEDSDVREAVLACWQRNLIGLPYWADHYAFGGVPFGGHRWARAMQQRTPDSKLVSLTGNEPLGGRDRGKGEYRVLVDDVATTGASLALNDMTISKRLVVVVRNPLLKELRNLVTAWMWVELDEIPPVQDHLQDH